MWSRTTIIVFFVAFVKTDADISASDEDTHPYVDISHYSPPHVNFNEIFAKSLTTLLLSDETTQASTTDNLHLTVPSNYVEFHSKTPVSTPPPLNVTTMPTNATSTNTSTTAPDTELKQRRRGKKNYQRGVLDLLFPAARVKNFKVVFDGIRRLLSHTFKK